MSKSFTQLIEDLNLLEEARTRRGLGWMSNAALDRLSKLKDAQGNLHRPDAVEELEYRKRKRKVVFESAGGKK